MLVFHVFLVFLRKWVLLGQFWRIHPFLGASDHGFQLILPPSPGVNEFFFVGDKLHPGIDVASRALSFHPLRIRALASHVVFEAPVPCCYGCFRTSDRGSSWDTQGPVRKFGKR